MLLCSEFANVILFIVSSERFSYMKDASRLKYIFDLKDLFASRPEIENCNDGPHINLVKEAEDIQANIDQLNQVHKHNSTVMRC